MSGTVKVVHTGSKTEIARSWRMGAGDGMGPVCGVSVLKHKKALDMDANKEYIRV